MSRVENVEVSILDPTAVEVGRGIGFGMKRGSILGVTALSIYQVFTQLSTT